MVLFEGKTRSLQRLGAALHVTPSRNLIARLEQAGEIPQIGSTVLDENLKPIGRIFDIIGPVSHPYVSIRPTVKDPQKLVI